MPTKARGPLQEDYVRALRAAKKMGAKAVMAYIGGVPIVIPLDDAYIKLLDPVQPPAKDEPSGGKPTILW